MHIAHAQPQPQYPFQFQVHTHDNVNNTKEMRFYIVTAGIGIQLNN